MGVRIKIGLLVFLGTLTASLSNGQVEFLDFIDPECMLDIESLIELWEIQNDESAALGNDSLLWTQRVSLTGMYSFHYLPSLQESRHKIRKRLKTRGVDVSFLANNDHLSSGIEFEPTKSKLKIVFGDFQFDAGLGLVFSSNKRFNSWSQSPINHLYRKRGFRVNTSGDSLRFLRGAGISFVNKEIGVKAFFSDNSSGLFLECEKERLQCGVGVTGFSNKGDSVFRSGANVKYSIKGGIFYGELSIQKDRAAAIEMGFCYFGHDRHSYILSYSNYSKGYVPAFSKLGFTRTSESDNPKLIFNYQWEWKNSWFLQADFVTVSQLQPAPTDLLPQNSWKIRWGVKKQVFDKLEFLSRLSIDPNGNKILLRWRTYVNERASYFQLETGWSINNPFDHIKTENFFAAIDFYGLEILRKVNVRSGFCMHRGDEKATLLYRYEPDLLYSMSLPVMSGAGLRAYMKLSYKPSKIFELEFKISRKVIYGKFEDSSENQFKVQLIIRPEFYVENS